jgi:hypothetical protein
MTGAGQSRSPEQRRRGYSRPKPLHVHPATYVPMSAKDEERMIAALSELLAPLFDEHGRLRPDPDDAGDDRPDPA